MTAPIAHTPARPLHRRHGMALVMVVTTLAVASLLAMTMLSSSALQAQMADSVPRIAQADYLAESGIHWAIAKLREEANSDEFNEPLPSNPSLLGKTYGPLALGTTGQCTVTITRGSTWDDFDILSSAVFTNPAGKTIAQARSQASVRVRMELKYEQAAVFGGNAVMTASGGSVQFYNIAANGSLRVSGGHSMSPLGSRLAWAKLHQWGTTVLGSNRKDFESQEPTTVPMSGNHVRPRSQHVRDFDSYVWSDGKVYQAATLPVTSGVCSSQTLGATSLNPAGVYRHTGDLRLGGDVRINGTLVVEGGSITLEGPGKSDLLGTYGVEIDATNSYSERFPALVVIDGGIYFSATPAPSGRLMRVQGVSYVAEALGTRSIPGGGVGTTVRFEGSVILPTALPASRGTMVFANADSSGNIDVPMLDRSLEATQIQTRSWRSITE